MDGLVLEGYRDGKLTETVWLNLKPGERDISVTFCQDGYMKIAEKERQKAQDIYERTEEYESIAGDAEQQEEGSTFSGDIDNDGKMERYKKWNWLPSTMNTWVELEFEIEEEDEWAAVKAAIFDRSEKWGTPVMLWIDAFDGKNIVNVIYRTGLYDYAIEGYLPDATGNYSTLYSIEGKAERTVEEIRTWEVPGKRPRLP